MQTRKVVVRCCICGREREGRDDWNYRYTPAGENVVHSHGVCGVCYHTEIMKLRMKAALPAAM